MRRSYYVKEDNVGKRLMDKLSFETKSAWDRLSKEQLKRVFAFADGYKMFLTQAKTEREANNYILTEAEKRGFVPADKAVSYTHLDVYKRQGIYRRQGRIR